MDVVRGGNRVRSCAQFPGQHNTADFDRPSPISLMAAAGGFDYGAITVKFGDAAAIQQPKQSKVIDAGKWALPITAEQVDLSPAK